jgi:hypothetical protein
MAINAARWNTVSTPSQKASICSSSRTSPSTTSTSSNTSGGRLSSHPHDPVEL